MDVRANVVVVSSVLDKHRFYPKQLNHNTAIRRDILDFCVRELVSLGGVGGEYLHKVFAPKAETAVCSETESAPVHRVLSGFPANRCLIRCYRDRQQYIFLQFCCQEPDFEIAYPVLSGNSI